MYHINRTALQTRAQCSSATVTRSLGHSRSANSSQPNRREHTATNPIRHSARVIQNGAKSFSSALFTILSRNSPLQQKEFYRIRRKCTSKPRTVFFSQTDFETTKSYLPKRLYIPLPIKQTETSVGCSSRRSSLYNSAKTWSRQKTEFNVFRFTTAEMRAIEGPPPWKNGFSPSMHGYSIRNFDQVETTETSTLHPLSPDISPFQDCQGLAIRFGKEIPC